MSTSVSVACIADVNIRFIYFDWFSCITNVDINVGSFNSIYDH